MYTNAILIGSIYFLDDVMR